MSWTMSSYLDPEQLDTAPFPEGLRHIQQQAVVDGGGQEIVAAIAAVRGIREERGQYGIQWVANHVNDPGFRKHAVNQAQVELIHGHLVGKFTHPGLQYAGQSKPCQVALAQHLQGSRLTRRRLGEQAVRKGSFEPSTC